MGEETRVRNPFVVKFREGNETGINVLCVELHKLCVSRDRRLAELVFEVAALRTKIHSTTIGVEGPLWCPDAAKRGWKAGVKKRIFLSTSFSSSKIESSDLIAHSVKWRHK